MRSAVVVISLSLGLVAAAAGQPAGGSGSQGELDPAIVEKIEELGGKVMRVAQNDPGVEVSFHLGRNHDGLRRFDASAAGNADPPAIDDELAVLGELDQLVSLHLGGTDVTDAGLLHLADLVTLKRLHLEKTSLTDAGLVHLAKLEQLSYLNLYQTGVTDAGLVHLKGLKNLRNLYLWQTEVTADGAESLQDSLPECDLDLGWDESEEVEEPEEPDQESDPDA